MKLPYGIIEVPRVVCSEDIGKWCQLPYPNHPKGCPNYGRKGCPPGTPSITKVMDLKKSVYIAFSEFDLDAHAQRMKELHPKWTRKQCRCVLYWQETSRKQMRGRAEKAKGFTGADLVLAGPKNCPEAYGVNVYATCSRVGLRLEKIRGLKICRHVALIGFGLET